jgi:hypothetical protein
MPKFDVWMETGVCVTVPRGTDASTDAGLEVIKAAAVEKFRAMLDSRDAGIDFFVEPFNSDED